MTTATRTQWTPRKQLVIATASSFCGERVLSGGRFQWTKAAKAKAHEMLEDRISQWRQLGINQKSVAYYLNCSDRALERLITDVLKEKS